jgi:hypothetical protein
MSQPTIPEVWSDIATQVQLLAISGVAGAFLRAAIAPEKEWRRRVIQGVMGAVSAIFLGGLLAHLVSPFVDAGPYSYLAAGFIMGSGGEVAMKALQDRLIGKGRK